MKFYAFKDILTILEWLDAGKQVPAAEELRPVLAFMRQCGLIAGEAPPRLTARGREYLRSVSAEENPLEDARKG